MGGFGFDDEDEGGSNFINLGGGMGGPGRRAQSFNIGGSPNKTRDFHQQDTAVEHDLYVGLEDIYKGCTKKMKISRNVISPDGMRRKEDKVLTINVKPGWKAGTKITFPREGDQTTGKIPADIVFIIRDKPHPLFKRENSDIRHTVKISLRDVSSVIFIFHYCTIYSIVETVFRESIKYALHNCIGQTTLTQNRILNHLVRLV